MTTTTTVCQATTLATVADLKDGQWAVIGSHYLVPVRIRYVDPAARGCVRVEWDHGRGTKATVRIMPGTNPVQISF